MTTDMGNVIYEEEYIWNSRGMKLFTCKWLPENNKPPKTLIFICHGYAMECSITMNSTGIRLAKAGFAIYGIDYEGHGKSAGLAGLVNNFDDIVDDCTAHFTNICESKENKGKMRYLLGESMGGAVALLVHRKMPKYWDGAVLVAPMCKIVEDRKPHPIVISVLKQICKVFPTWKLLPTPDVVDDAFKVAEVRKQIRENPYCYKGRPRLKTANELYRASTELEQRLEEVTLPFIVLHGEDDIVTDVLVSKQLHQVASSFDKTLKLYPKMWHGLLYGEPLENIEIVFSDIINWLDKRCNLPSSRLEGELKRENDTIKSKKLTF